MKRQQKEKKMRTHFGVFALGLLLAASLMVGCTPQRYFSWKNETSTGEVYLTILSVNQSGNAPVFTVQWHNNTEYEVTFDPWYTMERKEGNDWVDINIADVEFIEIAYVLEPHGVTEKTYTTAYFDVSEIGTYRIRANCTIHRGEESESCGVAVEFTVSATEKRYKLTVENPEYLYEMPSPRASFPAGETVTVKLSMMTDTGVLFLVNDKKVEQAPWESGQEYWIYTFPMPAQDTVIKIKTYDGFLRYPNEAMLIETYWLAHPENETVRVRNYYGAYGEGSAIVAIMDGQNTSDAQWEEQVGECVFRYPNGGRITVLHGGSFYTLPDAFERQLLTVEDLHHVLLFHMEAYDFLYGDAEGETGK